MSSDSRISAASLGFPSIATARASIKRTSFRSGLRGYLVAKRPASAWPSPDRPGPAPTGQPVGWRRRPTGHSDAFGDPQEPRLGLGRMILLEERLGRSKLERRNQRRIGEALDGLLQGGQGISSMGLLEFDRGELERSPGAQRLGDVVGQGSQQPLGLASPLKPSEGQRSLEAGLASAARSEVQRHRAP